MIRVVWVLHGVDSESVTVLEWQFDWKSAIKVFDHLTSSKVPFLDVSGNVLRHRTRSKF